MRRHFAAFTFTDKAAAELKERIITRARQALGGVTGPAEMFVGTIHAFCLELLKNEAPAPGRAGRWCEHFLTDKKNGDPDIPELVEAKQRLAALAEVAAAVPR